MLKKIILIAVIALSFMGCRKDEENVLPTNQLNSVTYPKTLADLNTFLIPGYSNFRNANLYGYMYLSMVLSCDHSFCSQNSSGNPFTVQGGDFLTNNIKPTNTLNDALYSQLYQGVAAMNIFFDRANYYQANFGDSTDVNAMRGQAYFLRAYYFYLLECYYGEQYIDMTQPQNPNILGVPMPLQFATTVAQTNLPRSSAYQVWSQIISDLKQSAKYLANVTYSQTNQGRITQWAAYGMLGKAYVFTKQYDSAKTYLLKVINNGVNSLVPFSQYKNSFNGNPANEFNSESLFEINVDRQGNNSILFSSNFLNSLTTDAGVLYAPTVISATGVDTTGNGDGNGGNSSSMGNNYCKFFVHDMSLRRFGFNLPVYGYDRNPNATPANNNATNPTFIMDSVSWKASLAMRTNNTVDPRLFVCALEPWVDSVEQPYQVSTNPLNALGYPDTVPVGKAFIIDGNRADYWGWSFKKFATLDNDLLAYGDNDAANLLLLRLADVYLLYAEACANTGDNADALLYINKVHERAYSGSSAYDYHSLTDATMAVKDSSAADILANNPLMYERYVELFGEGGWWFDVCRWGIGANEAAYYVYGSAEYYSFTGTPPQNSLIVSSNWTGNGTNSKAYHFPIPDVEMATNPAIQRNNYGY